MDFADKGILAGVGAIFLWFTRAMLVIYIRSQEQRLALERKAREAESSERSMMVERLLGNGNGDRGAIGDMRHEIGELRNDVTKRFDGLPCVERRRPIECPAQQK